MRKLLFVSFLSLSFFFLSTRLTAQAISVFAGDDLTICSSQSLDLSFLNASISGLVSDGNWFTMGDGYFLPDATSFHAFSSVTYYVPGTNDIINGSVVLILVSEDPDGFGPITEVSDQVTITLRSDMAMFCKNNINVSLNTICQQELLPELLIANPVQPYNLYNIESFDAAGQLIANNILTHEHIGQTISFGVFYECNNNSCWGSLTVEDKFAPTFNCYDLTISCLEDDSPEVIGFPISVAAQVDTLIGDTYTISGMDSCGLSYINYDDLVIPGVCTSDTMQLIRRTWYAQDESNNQSLCVQRILVEKIAINEVILPENYDGLSLPAFECGGDWPTLASGYPSPDTTGIPVLGNCSYMDIHYDDIAFATCGNTLKILRDWTVIEWCHNTSISYNQVIIIRDEQAPHLVCPDDLTISTYYGLCQSQSIAIAIDTLEDSCNQVALEMSIKSQNNNIIVPFTSVPNPNTIAIPALPLGIFEVSFRAIDLCGNMSECSMFITVLDQVGPYAVCDEFTVVSLVTDGTGRIYAESLDDGSFDDCSEVSFLVKKNSDSCNDITSYGPFVQFCCEEIGVTQEVTLLVTDSSGNTNECQVFVTVEDDVTPTVTCPPDLTISCTGLIDTLNLDLYGSVVPAGAVQQAIVIHDDFNSGIVGYDGVYTDNCFASFSQSFYTDLTCNAGTITRTFMVTDEFGLQTSCQQEITILNANPFNINDIIWPDTISFEGCGIDMDNLDMMGRPVLNDDYCAVTASTYDDTVFEFVDGACTKILREWTVIDWCQYNANPGTGIWNHVQIIKQNNNTKPEFISSQCLDTLVCIYENCETSFSHEVSATDDCTPTPLLAYTWLLDMFNDGTVDTMGMGNVYEDVLVQGIHELQWTVEDGCGNINYCSQLITVEDCKAPTPYCLNGLTTVLMDVSGSVGVWASEFNLGSYDNCDEQSVLSYSFDQAQSVDMVMFSCDDINNGISQEFVLQLWVTDSSGNQEFCDVHVVIQDNNNDVCPDISSTVPVYGYVKNDKNYVPVGTKVTAHLGLDTTIVAVIQNNTDPFVMDLKIGATYDFNCENRLNYAQGVSSLDILIIQKHILDIQPLTSLYSIIAADINRSNSISGVDLAELQKLVLGTVDTLRSNDSWRFIPYHINTLNPDNYFDFPENIMLAVDPSELSSIDFMAIKVGDVNGTISTLNNNEITQNRYDKGNLLVAADGAYDHVYIDHDMELEALQFALRMDEDLYSELIVKEGVEHSYQDGILRVLKVDALGFSSSFEDPILSIPHTAMTTLSLVSDIGYDAFFVDKEGVISYMSIDFTKKMTSFRDFDFDVYPNPFSEALYIEMDQVSNDNIKIYVTDIQGSLLLQRTYLDASSLVIRRSDLKIPGIYFLNISMGDEVITKKIVLQF